MGLDAEEGLYRWVLGNSGPEAKRSLALLSLQVFSDLHRPGKRPCPHMPLCPAVRFYNYIIYRQTQPTTE
jgi:hypothetical protein